MHGLGILSWDVRIYPILTTIQNKSGYNGQKNMSLDYCAIDRNDMVWWVKICDDDVRVVDPMDKMCIA